MPKRATEVPDAIKQFRLSKYPMKKPPVPEEEVLREQRRQLRATRIRVYQTYIIFRKARLAKRGLKLLNFLGIVVPLIAGGIIMSLYSESKAPPWVVVVAGLLGLAQTVGSVWALVDEWDRKAQLSEKTVQEFRDLYIRLDSLRPDAGGFYDQSILDNLEQRSYGGLHLDEEIGVRPSEWASALKQAEAKYPPEEPN